MRRMLGAVLMSVLLPALMPASEFDAVVHEFERQTGSIQTHIPFFGLARFIVGVSHPAGASDLRLAVFEHPGVTRHDFGRVTDSIVSGNWKRIVRVWSRQGEITSIYSREEGNHLRMLIATVDRNDATFVELRIRPDKLARFIDEHHGGR